MDRLCTTTVDGKPVDWSDYRSVRLHPLVILTYRSLLMNTIGLLITHTVVRRVARRRAPRDVPVAITLVVSLTIITTFAVDGLCNVMLVSQLGLDAEKYSETFGKVLHDMRAASDDGQSFDLGAGAGARRVKARVKEMSSNIGAALGAGGAAARAGAGGGGGGGGGGRGIAEPAGEEPDLDDLAAML